MVLSKVTKLETTDLHCDESRLHAPYIDIVMNLIVKPMEGLLRCDRLKNTALHVYST